MALTSRVDVTAVKMYDDFIFAGIGSFMYIYKNTLSKAVQKLTALLGQKIYGFVLSPSREKVLVFGGKQFTVVIKTENAQQENIFVQDFEAIVCDDWLHSAIWIDESSIALLTAHNVVQKWCLKNQCLLSQHSSANNSILYCGLLLPLEGDVLVLAGTVFSEVLVHRCQTDKTMHILKGHRGVIFSISCRPERNLLVTTSDDRSVRIWNINSKSSSDHKKVSFWENSDIVCIQEVYGHFARVMRSCITNIYIISVGEDAALCFWNHDGKLLKKTICHQNSPIWAVDANDTHLVTGGGDCGVTLHPLTVAEYNGAEEIITVDKPKKLSFTARRNIVVLRDDNYLIYYDVESKTNYSCKLEHESTYKLLSLSCCKQLIAVADMFGNLDIFAERGKDIGCIFKILNTKVNLGKILSMHWAGNRHLVFCSDNGEITVLASNGTNTAFDSNYLLPTCKERWLTAAATDHCNRFFVVGDRCGNIHVFGKGKKDPFRTFNKVHGRYGPTSITIKDNVISTTGRNGIINFFSINKDNVVDIKFENSKNVEIQWLDKFLDKNQSVVCGFHERYFVVLNLKNNSKLIELPCGGGHRSWDAIRFVEKINDKYEEIIRFVYIKNADLNLINFELSKLVTKNIINGSHSKEINCLKAYKCKYDDTTTFFISGGGDTTLRISKIDFDDIFEDVHLFKHLSIVRSLKTLEICDDKLLLISAGGRAQICVKLLEFCKKEQATEVKVKDLIDYMIKGTDRVRKGNRKWIEQTNDFDPETRIMDLEIKLFDNKFIVFAGCSDAHLRVYKLLIDTKQPSFEAITEFKAHATCILKTHLVSYVGKDFLVTCTTRGEVAFWEVSTEDNFQNFSHSPYFNLRANKSGINCFSYYVTNRNELLIATGGDDNTVNLNLLVEELNSFVAISSQCSSKFHCSQITGLFLLDRNLVTTSIDQRVTLAEWRSDDAGVAVAFVSQTHSDVADIQGMDLIEDAGDHVTVCVFGKGIEVLKIMKPKKVCEDL